MRVNGFECLKKQGFKKLILVVKHHDGLCSIRQPIQIIRSRLALGGDGKGDLLLEVSKAVTEFDMDMGCICLLGMLTVPLSRGPRSGLQCLLSGSNWREILSNPAYGNAGKFTEVWMDGARGEGPRRSTMSLRPGLKPFVTYPGPIVWFSPLRELVFAGLEMNEAMQGSLVAKSQARPVGDRGGIRLSTARRPLWNAVFNPVRADVSLRPGWFYHEDQDPKSLEELVRNLLSLSRSGCTSLIQYSA